MGLVTKRIKGENMYIRKKQPGVVIKIEMTELEAKCLELDLYWMKKNHSLRSQTEELLEKLGQSK